MVKFDTGATTAQPGKHYRHCENGKKKSTEVEQTALTNPDERDNPINRD